MDLGEVEESVDAAPQFTVESMAQEPRNPTMPKDMVDSVPVAEFRDELQAGFVTSIAEKLLAFCRSVAGGFSHAAIAAFQISHGKGDKV